MKTMESRTVCFVRIRAWTRRNGQAWLTWCPSIDVMTQAKTRRAAMDALREAVELWFQSCIDRGVLGNALEECGFSASPVEYASDSDESVYVVKQTVVKREAELLFSVGRKQGAHYIEGHFPAHLAAKQLGDAASARG